MTYKNVLKGMTLILLIISIGTSIGARIKLNGAGGAYVTEGETSTAVEVENYIIEGAGYYLSANSNIQLLLNQVELQEAKTASIDVSIDTLNQSLIDLKQAIDTYFLLIQSAESHQYNAVVIEKLKSFDYSAFSQENNLNAIVFDKVAEYLKTGDVTGVFRENHASLQEVMEILAMIENQIYENKEPEQSLWWTLNEKLSESSLFGSYVARIFSEINK